MPISSRMLRLAPWVIGVGGLLLFTLGLDDRDFIHLEARFALFAQEMLRQGVSVFPTTYGEPYPDYPATDTILIDLGSRAVGKVTTLTAVLPTAAAAALTLVFTYLIGAQYSPRWGLYAVLFEVCTYQYLATARSVSLDPFVALAVTACFYAAYASERMLETGRVTLLATGLIFGFVMRGPIGLILPAAVVAACDLLDRRWRRFLAISLIALVLLAVGSAGLLAAAREQGGEAFARQVLHQEAIGRLTESTRHPPIYFYPVNALSAFALSFPVAVVLSVFAWGAWVKPVTAEWRLIRRLAAWTLVIMAGLSIPTKQEIRYLIPIVPAVSLMAAAVLAVPPPTAMLWRLRTWLIGLFRLLPWLGLGLLIIGMGIPRIRALLPVDASPVMAALILGMLAAAALWSTRRLRGEFTHELSAVVIGVAAFVTTVLLIVEPVAIDLNRVRPFVEDVRSHRASGAPIVFYKIKPDSSDIKFMAALDEPVRPLFVQTAAEVAALSPDVVVIATRDDFDALPPEVKALTRLLAEGRIARSHCAAFAVGPPPG